MKPVERKKRLQSRDLRTLLLNKFLQEYGYERGKVVAKQIVEDILNTIRDLIPEFSGHGTSFSIIGVHREATPSRHRNLRLEETAMAAANLNLATSHEKREVDEGRTTPSKLRKVRAIRFFQEAAEQDVLLTNLEVAFYLGCSPGTVGKWVREYQERTQTLVPTRGNLHDLGSGITHKRQIITLYLQGKAPSEIRRQTQHSLRAIDRYIKGFETVRRLSQREPDRDMLARLSGMGRKLVLEYLELLGRVKRPEEAEQGSAGGQPCEEYSGGNSPDGLEGEVENLPLFSSTTTQR